MRHVLTFVGIGRRWLLAFAVALVASVLLASPAWAQEKTNGQKVSTGQRAQIERLSDKQAEEQFVRAAQNSDDDGDLAGEPATATASGDTGEEVDRIVIEGAENCVVAPNATITFRETTGERRVAVVSDEEGKAIIDPQDDRIVVTGDPPDDIEFAAGHLDPGPLEVLSSSGIDCDGDNDDGFDDELLLLLLLELLEDEIDDDNDDGNNDDDFFDDNDGDLFDEEEDLFDEEEDLFDEEEDLATAEEDLLDEGTGSSFADPDTRAPVGNPRGDIVDEVANTGRGLPPTGGGISPLAAAALATPLAVATLALTTLLIAGIAIRRFGTRRRR